MSWQPQFGTVLRNRIKIKCIYYLVGCLLDADAWQQNWKNKDIAGLLDFRGQTKDSMSCLVVF